MKDLYRKCEKQKETNNMKKAVLCTKCEAPTTMKRVKINLVIEEETNNLMPVSARMQACTACGNKEYTEKEINRLRELTAFYKKESVIQEAEEKEQEELDNENENENEEDEFEDELEDERDIA
jgi:predicted nucleic-acid-binding Zn-ribbon protein